MTTSDEMKLRKREEYEMQLFGFHSRAVSDGSKGTTSIILEEVQSVCQKLCTAIQNKYQPGPEELSLLRKEMKQLIQTYENNADTQMEKLNNITEKFISIPDNVLLDEDKDQAIQISRNEFEELSSKMEDLQKRAKRATMFNAALRQELQVQQSFKACQDAIDGFGEEIERNTILPNLENEIIKFTEEAEKLNMQLAILETPNAKDIYNPKVKNLKEFHSIS